MDYENIKERLQTHIAKTTGFLTVSTPLGAIMENVCADITDARSIKSRVMALGLLYGGYGVFVDYTRKKSREFFNITEKTRGGVQQLHDMLYLATATMITNPFIYLTVGERDLKKIAGATLLATAFALGGGGLIGYAMDSFKDLAGLEKCERPSYQRLTRRLGPRGKKAIIAATIATSLALSSLIYKLTPPKLEERIVKEEIIPQ